MIFWESMKAKKIKHAELAAKTKRFLIEMLVEDECSVEEVLRYASLTRKQLVAKIKNRDACYSRPLPPCPNGHAQDDPRCDLLCFLTMLESGDLPFYTLRTPLRCEYTLHDWTKE